MTFLHATLLAGIGLVIVPILLHMMAKSQPKKLVFPALRFVRATAVVAERGWKVKHWLLLAMRVLLIAMLALALAYPRVSSAMLATYLSIGTVMMLAVFASVAALVAYASRRPWIVCGIAGLIAAFLWITSLGWGALALTQGAAPPTQSNSGPIAAAIVVDTSPTMGYKSNNKTRLEVAKEMGSWLIDRFPVESQISIVTSDQGLRLSTDRITAERQLARAAVDGKSASLPQRIRSAVELVRGSNLERREVYVLTDLAQAAWKESNPAEIAERMRKEPAVLLQMVDVGVEKGQNWSMLEPSLSQQVIAPGGSVELQAEVIASTLAPMQQLVIELLRETDNTVPPFQRNGKTITPDLKPVDRQILDLQPGESKVVRFVARELGPGTHHFVLRINQPDPLPIDNEAYLCVEVADQGQFLVVSDDLELGRQIAVIMNPEENSEKKNSSGNQTDYFRIDTANFARYSSIILFDPPDMSSSLVEKLEQYVAGGGGLMILLGAKFADANKLNATPYSKLLPGLVDGIHVEKSRNNFFDPVTINHPIFHPFDKVVEDAPWQLLPVFRYWQFKDLSSSAAVLIRYSKTGSPAVIEETRGQGKILTWTTPLPEPDKPDGRDAWNELWSATDYWPSYALMLGSMGYLSGWGKYQFNYQVGETAILENDAAIYPARYEVFAPMDEHLTRDVEEGILRYPFTAQPGPYRFLGQFEGRSVLRGFAVHLRKEDMPLDRITPETLDMMLGKDRYAIAKDKSEVTSSIGTARFGRDLYPFLMAIIVGLILAEQAMSSRFYSIRFSGSATGIPGTKATASQESGSTVRK